MIIIMLINIMTIVLIKIIIIIMNNKQNDINNNDKYVEAYKKEYVRWVQKNCDIGTKLPASEKAFHNSSHHMLSMGLGHQSRNLPTGSGNHAKAAAVCQLFQQENDTCDMLQVHTLHQTDSTPWDACKELRWQSFASPPSLPRPPAKRKEISQPDQCFKHIRTAKRLAIVCNGATKTVGASNCCQACKDVQKKD